MPLYLSKDTLAAADQATAEAQTSGLSDDVRQTMEQATKPPEPVASPWTIPSLESLGLPSLPSLPAATSPVMSAIGAVPQIGQRTVQMGQDAGQVAVRWALPSLEGLGVVPPKPQQPASDGSEPPTPSSSAPAPEGRDRQLLAGVVRADGLPLRARRGRRRPGAREAADRQRDLRERHGRVG